MSYPPANSWSKSNRLHGDKISLHKFDRLVTFWRDNGGDLSALCQGKLGQNMTDYQPQVVAA